MKLPDRIVLIGPSGSGKSAVSARLATLTGFVVADTDEIIVARTGMTTAAFFARFGEAAFRTIEAAVIAEACREPRRIVATGGGAVLTSANWSAMRPGSVIVGLTGSPSILINRIREQARLHGDDADRPLLSGDAESRLAALIAARRDLYAAADVTIDTDALEPDQVARQALSAVLDVVEGGKVPHLSLDTPLGRSDIFVSAGARGIAPDAVHGRWPRASRIWLISDSSVDAVWGESVAQLFIDARFTVSRLCISPGETSKSFSQVERLCREMTDGGVTRRDVVVALGGGVVGDLAGFVASVCLRGLGLVQLPTSLLAMVDSSVGGKTGVNLPAGKNLVGAFYQPSVVIVDSTFLESLPISEYRSGMAEIIKHSVIQPSTPFGGTSLRKMLLAHPLDPLSADVIDEVLALNVSIKHSVVQADERENGLRMILNFGHTAGHAIEADGYLYRHGEAVAIGMVIASRIALAMDRVDESWVEDLETILRRAALPVRFDGDVEAVIARMARDKKFVDGSLHWVLPKQQGGVDIISGVSEVVVRRAVIDAAAISVSGE
jgi:shikimate kinase / 3-dehydroquinate synthase